MRKRVISLIACLFLVACSDGTSKYVGTWREVSLGRETVQLLKDGTFISGGPGIPVAGTWKSDDEGGILIQVTAFGTPMALRGKIEGGALITNFNGKKTTFQKST